MTQESNMIGRVFSQSDSSATREVYIVQHFGILCWSASRASFLPHENPFLWKEKYQIKSVGEVLECLVRPVSYLQWPCSQYPSEGSQCPSQIFPHAVTEGLPGHPHQDHHLSDIPTCNSQVYSTCMVVSPVNDQWVKTGTILNQKTLLPHGVTVVYVICRDICIHTLTNFVICALFFSLSSKASNSSNPHLCEIRSTDNTAPPVCVKHPWGLLDDSSIKYWVLKFCISPRFLQHLSTNFSTSPNSLSSRMAVSCQKFTPLFVLGFVNLFIFYVGLGPTLPLQVWTLVLLVSVR